MNFKFEDPENVICYTVSLSVTLTYLPTLNVSSLPVFPIFSLIVVLSYDTDQMGVSQFLCGICAQRQR